MIKERLERFSKLENLPKLTVIRNLKEGVSTDDCRYNWANIASFFVEKYKEVAIIYQVKKGTSIQKYQ